MKNNKKEGKRSHVLKMWKMRIIKFYTNDFLVVIFILF